MSRTKKNLIIIFSIIVSLVFLMVLFGALFSLKTINVDYATGINRVKEYSKKDMINKSGIKLKSNIVFASYEKNIDNLEKAFPFGKFKVVRTFPNKVVIYVYEREPVFKVQVGDGFWHIYDESLKCLEIVADANLSQNRYDEIPVLDGVDLELSLEVGDTINNKEFKKTLTNIIDGVYGAGETKLSLMSNIILDNKVDLGYTEYVFKVTKTNATLVIKGDSFLKEKIAYAVYLYLNSVSSDPEYTTILDKVTITVNNNFQPNAIDTSVVVSVDNN